MRFSNFAKARTFLVNKKTGERTLATDWTNNLVFDIGLNSMAGGALGFADIFNTCLVGSSNLPNSINSTGAIFTQSGTTITASSSFFTAAMVGAIFKYGAAGDGSGSEQYIISVPGGGLTCVVSGAGQTVSTPTAGTVWMVQRTGLVTPLYASNTYGVTGNGSTWTSNVLTLQREFIFAVQGTSYTVNEVAYSSNTTLANSYGRIVLPSSVVVSTAFFLVVDMQFTWTQTPASPVAKVNVGVNFDTTGNLMVQNWQSTYVNSNGSTGFDGGGGNPNFTTLDKPFQSSSAVAFHLVNDITLNSAIGAKASIVVGAESIYTGTLSFTNSGQPVGVALATVSFNTTSAGQTCYALVIGSKYVSTGNRVNQCIVLLLTTPQTLPTGSLQGSLSFKLIYSRSLVN